MNFDDHFKSVTERIDRQEREVLRQQRWARRSAFFRGLGTLIWRAWIIAAVTAGLYIAAVVFQIRLPW